MTQTIIALIIVGGCVTYVAWRWWRVWSGKAGGCCGCGTCHAAKPAEADSTARGIAPENAAK